MTGDDIHGLATVPTAWRAGEWWEREAAMAYARGDYLLIPGRTDDQLYLARFWLSAAVRRPSSAGGEAIESGDSLLLHFFARGDDDQALHTHPWSFRTTILAGGYVEHLPPHDWQPTSIDRGPGPEWDARHEFRRVGMTMAHVPSDLHCVGEVQPGTWTIVRTGPRVVEWGFHPTGAEFQHYRAFLEAGKASA